MKLGAEPKKVAILAGLLCVALFFFWKNVLSTDTGGYTPPPAARSTPAPKPIPAARPATRTAARPERVYSGVRSPVPRPRRAHAPNRLKSKRVQHAPNM